MGRTDDMSVRKLTLSEWFIVHQLRAVERQHFHVNSLIEVDLSALQEAYGERDLPLTFIVVKALALTLKHVPEINRQYIKSFWGPRLIQAEHCSVNLPVMLQIDGEAYLSVTTLKNADRKSITELKNEVKAYFSTPKSELRVGKYIIGKRNHCLNRQRLRLIHYLVNRLPHLSDRLQVGTASVSSMLHLAHAGTQVAMVGRGPGAFSVTLCHHDPVRQRMQLAIAWDHFTGQGIDGDRGMITLCRILQRELEPDALVDESI